MNDPMNNMRSFCECLLVNIICHVSVKPEEIMSKYH